MSWPQLEVRGGVLQPSQSSQPGLAVASYASTGNTAAVTNVINYIPPAATGTYRLTIQYRPTATGASTSVGVSITYKDSAGAETETGAPFMQHATTALAVPPFLNTGSTNATAVYCFAIDNSATAITVSTTGTFTGTTYNFTAVLERLL